MIDNYKWILPMIPMYLFLHSFFMIINFLQGLKSSIGV